MVSVSRAALCESVVRNQLIMKLWRFQILFGDWLRAIHDYLR